MTGEFAEGWQHAMFIRKIKAGEAKGLLRHSPDFYSRVQVAAENIFFTRLFFEAGIMAKAELADAIFLMMHINPTLPIPGFTQDIMIAFYQVNF